MEDRFNRFGDPELKLSKQGSIDYARRILPALQVRLRESTAAAVPLSLEERQAWRLILKPIDKHALGEAAEYMDKMLETMDTDIQFQARIELGRVATIDPDLPEEI